jgi:hypothetical protein
MLKVIEGGGRVNLGLNGYISETQKKFLTNETSC